MTRTTSATKSRKPAVRSCIDKRLATARPFTFTAPGIAPVWRETEIKMMSARPANATARCACCDDVYATKGMKPLDSDYTYSQVIKRELARIERDDVLCVGCRASLMAEVGTERIDTFNIDDVLYSTDGYDG